ncbi:MULTISPECIES: hypothetical protein [Streptomyces]|uniref:hypothetical protein n=1 Tax=Streptomyces TaxID=1883 RepID=UPI00167B741B|nr:MULTISPECIES: hypothetical protein [Streptomyces]MBK3520729.1 hypothetical protein [Streptomyces sp. MBT70]
MMTIAVTGHMDLTEDTIPLVRAALDDLLKPYAYGGDLVGISCIAKGADSLFAEAVLRAGGRFAVVIPSRDYRRKKVKADHAALFDRLAQAADGVLVLPDQTVDRQAYDAASVVLLRRTDRLVALRDGTPPSGKGGGTADTVEEARAAGIPVSVVWPAGPARRSVG